MKLPRFATNMLLPLFLLPCAVLYGGPAENLLTNGDLMSWDKGLPKGWEVSIGAQQGTGKKSVLSIVKGGGLALSGDATVEQWQFVGQMIDVDPGSYYQISFESRVRDFRIEGQQNMNCYVGIITRHPEGGLGPSAVRPIVNSEWASGAATLAVPRGVNKIEAAIFLSNTGTLEARNLVVRKVEPRDSYDVLALEFSRYYSFFELKKTDWKKLSKRHRSKLRNAGSAQQFKELVKNMLASLQDEHVWVQMPGRQIEPTYRSQPQQNYNYKALMPQLSNGERIGRLGYLGRTKDGYGYLYISTFQGNKEEFQLLEQKLISLFDAPGIIIDLRANGGGNEYYAQRLAGHFTKTPIPYARNLRRMGREPGDLGVVGTRTLRPTQGELYEGPIICMTGPVCMSSGEGCALMFKALPNCTVMGQPTRGASGNPQPVTLPNGVIVHYSTWVAQLPDGTDLEGKGVPVDIAVKHGESGDPTFEAAVKELTRRIHEKKRPAKDNKDPK